MKCFVTGGAGFIGSHLVTQLLADGHEVTAYDNLSLGKKEFIAQHLNDSKFKFIEGDLLDEKKLHSSMKGHDVVWHLAANSDIIQSAKHTRIDLEQGTIATYNVLEAMRNNNVKKIVFSSSNVVYGEAKTFPTPETYGPLFPISMYGASKLASEGLITAYCHNFNMQSWIYRFCNVVGTRITHGVLLDFYHKLQKDSKTLHVLGNGKQSKPYLHVRDCVNGMIHGFKHGKDPYNVYNLGADGSTSVAHIAQWALKELQSDAAIKYEGGERGWPGDVHTVNLDMSKLLKLGWKREFEKSDDVVKEAIKEIYAELNA